ncbi:Pyruvate decarboxylase 1 [Exophiala oligosperma]
MGVPGDMNLELLDYVKEVPGLNWVGNANELNAAYAADGYARVKGCPGVLVTTMGVGELSAINGLAGSYTEQVKIIHIVGTTSRAMQEKHLMIHHCLGPNPDHRVYEKMSAHVRCTHAWLDDEKTAVDEIDRVIRQCWIDSLPAYIFVPMDMVRVPVPVTALDTAVDVSYPSDISNEDAVVQKIKETILNSTRPILLVDCLVARHEATKQARRLFELLDIPTFTTPMGKTIIDESHPRFCGVYNGTVSYPGIKDEVEGSDCVLNLGPLLSDSNTGGHSREIDSGSVILVEPSSATVFGKKYTNVYLRPLLSKLLLAFKDVDFPRRPNPKFPPEPQPLDMTTATPEIIKQNYVWKRLGRFSRPGDILVVDCGTAQFGMSEATFSSGSTYVTQLYFGSIGYSVPSCLGVGLAQREMTKRAEAEANDGNASPPSPSSGGRLILIVGDGSLQLTVQEMGSIIKHGLNPIIFLINNDGYTIERAIHGPQESYNDITTWDHTHMLQFFGANDGDKRTTQVRSKAEMEAVLEESSAPQKRGQDTLRLIEVFMDRMDVPWRLKRQIDLIMERAKAAAAATTTKK